MPVHEAVMREVMGRKEMGTDTLGKVFFDRRQVMATFGTVDIPKKQEQRMAPRELQGRSLGLFRASQTFPHRRFSLYSLCKRERGSWPGTWFR